MINPLLSGLLSVQNVSIFGSMAIGSYSDLDIRLPAIYSVFQETLVCPRPLDTNQLEIILLNARKALLNPSTELKVNEKAPLNDKLARQFLMVFRIEVGLGEDPSAFPLRDDTMILSASPK